MIKKMIEVVQESLYEVSGLYVVETNSNAMKPDKPFISYNLINMRTKLDGQGIYTMDEKIETVEQQPQAILSIQAYGNSDIEAVEAIREAYRFFKHNNKLYDDNFVVVDMTDVQDRTIYITDSYEYRYGFDVWIRYLDRIERKDYTIDNWEVEYNND